MPSSSREISTFANRTIRLNKIPYVPQFPWIGAPRGRQPETIGRLVARSNHNQKDYENSAERGAIRTVLYLQKYGLLEIPPGVDSNAWYIPSPEWLKDINVKYPNWGSDITCATVDWKTFGNALKAMGYPKIDTEVITCGFFIAGGWKGDLKNMPRPVYDADKALDKDDEAKKEFDNQGAAHQGGVEHS